MCSPLAAMDGAATAAGLALPRGLTMDAAGNLYFADSANHRIRRISPSGVITTVAGQGTENFAGDGAPAVSASLDSPRSVAVSPAGLLTLADSGNQRVRQLDALPAPGPDIHTIAGLGTTIVVSRALAQRAVGGCLWQRLGHRDAGHLYNCNRQRYISGYKRRSADHAGHGGPDLRLGELQHCHAGCWRAQPRRHLRRRCEPWRGAVLRTGDDGDAARRHHCAQPRVNPLRPGHSPAQRHAHGRSRARRGEGRGGLHFYRCGLVSRGTLSHLRDAYRQRGGQLHGRRNACRQPQHRAGAHADLALRLHQLAWVGPSRYADRAGDEHHQRRAHRLGHALRRQHHALCRSALSRRGHVYHQLAHAGRAQPVRELTPATQTSCPAARRRRSSRWARPRTSR